MTHKNDTFCISYRLEEVWAWKDEIAKEVEGMNIEEAMAVIQASAKKLANELNLPKAETKRFTHHGK